MDLIDTEIVTAVQRKVFLIICIFDFVFCNTDNYIRLPLV